MPRAFLLTHRRYPKLQPEDEQSEETQEEEIAPSDPLEDQFFNLTQLAEVSLAAGHLETDKNLKADKFVVLPPLSPSKRIFNRDRGVYHECGECGKKYTTSSNLARHKQVHRDINDKKARRCPHCDKLYVSVPAFSMHLRTHVQDCRCDICGKSFSRPWLLQGHIRTHTGEKPFKCSICNKAFADRSNLRAHVQTHSTRKPHTCKRCGKSFALKSYLYKHEESSCMKPGDERFLNPGPENGTRESFHSPESGTRERFSPENGTRERFSPENGTRERFSPENGTRKRFNSPDNGTRERFSSPEKGTMERFNSPENGTRERFNSPDKGTRERFHCPGNGSREPTRHGTDNSPRERFDTALNEYVVLNLSEPLCMAIRV